jgi:hypothetical protein
VKVRELAAALAALPEKYQDLHVFSTCDWDFVSEIDPEPGDLGQRSEESVVEIS